MTRANTEQSKHTPWFAKAGAACSIVPIARFVGPSIFALKGGGYGCLFALTGIDEEGLTDLELDSRMRSIEGALRGLPEGSCLYQYTRVMSGFNLPRKTRYANPATEVFVTDRLTHLEKTAAFRRIDLHWCLTLEPSQVKAFEQKPQENAVDTSRMLAELEKTATILQSHLGSALGLRLLDKADAFQFFSYLFNLEEWAGQDQLRSDTGVDRQIVKSPVAWHSDYLQVGKCHVQMFSLKATPEASRPCLFSGLLALDCDSILCSTWRVKSTSSARSEIDAQEKFISFFKVGVLTRVMSGRDTASLETGAGAKAANNHVDDLSEVIRSLDKKAQGEYSLRLLLAARSQEQLRNTVPAVHRIFVDARAQVMEETLGNLSAFYAMFPGNHKFNVFPLWLAEDHHARLSSVFAPHIGHPHSEDLDSEYLNIFETRTGTPFFQDVYVDGVRVMLIIGPTGSGKSTLVQDVLSDYPLSIPYFAYLPDGLGNARERGDALTFFKDVVARLDRNFEGRHALGLHDLTQGKQAFRDHMRRANELFRTTTQKTIVLIDGLDHVQREEGINSSLLHELPRPDEVPEGFVIILSTQPQTLIAGAIERHVAGHVSPSSSARITVDGLGRNEIHTIATRTEPSLSYEDCDLISDACQGNPLILTYLLKFYGAHPATGIEEAIRAVGEYSGDIEAYYHASLSLPLQNTSIRHALALLSRAIVPIPFPWLRTWPESRELEEIYEQHLQPFVKIDDDQLHFIHNSLLVFLRNNTRSRFPGQGFEAEDRELYKKLAQRCGPAKCSERIGRAKIHYLRYSGQDDLLLDSLTSDWLREGIESFIPHIEIRPLILHGFSSAWSLDRYGEVLRLLLLDFELSQRSNRLDSGNLAANFLKLDETQLAAVQIRSAGRILLEDREEFEAAETLARYGDTHDQVNIYQLGRDVYLHAKPINYLYRSEPLEYHDTHFAFQSLHRWASCAPHFETADRICDQILDLKLAEREGEWQQPPEHTKAGLLRAAFLAASWNGNSYEELFPYLRALAELHAAQLLFASLIVAYRIAPSARRLRALNVRYRHITEQRDLSLQYAEILLREGYTDEAREVASALKRTTIEEHHDPHAFGLTAITFNTRLVRLKEVLGIEPESLPTVSDGKQEPGARLRRVCIELGQLFSKAWAHELPPDLKNLLRSILLFANRPVSIHEIDFHGRFALKRFSDTVHTHLINVAELFGEEGMKALRDAFQDVVGSGAAMTFTPEQSRRFALELWNGQVMTSDEAARTGLLDDSDITDKDPAVRVQACFDIAAFLKALGKSEQSSEWVAKASKTSAGAGEHKDYHMWHLADWIGRSCQVHFGDRELQSIDQFLRSAQVAGGDGAWRACATTLKQLMRYSPQRAWKLAVEFVDKDMMSVSHCLSSLLEGGASHGASSLLSGALYSNLQLILATDDTADTAEAVLRSAAPDNRVSLALELADAVRTYAIPDRRAAILRTLQDTLHQLGHEEALTGVELLSGRDDSAMKSSLYRLSTGEIKTRAEMTRTLSDFSRRDEWNPNPSENEDFHWESALFDVNIADVHHADALLQAFNFSSHSEVRLLTWRSRVQLNVGNRQEARSLAEQAITLASKDGTWLERLDGAKLKVAYEALIRVDRPAGIRQARERFGNDLSTGTLWSTLLLNDIPEIFDALAIPWPADEVLDTISSYLDKALAASRESEPMNALSSSEPSISADAALCRFAIHLLAFPVFEVGLAARRSLAEFIATNVDGATVVFDQRSVCDSIQLEHLLAAIDCRVARLPDEFQEPIELLRAHESIGVRSIAFRLCQKNGWRWTELRDQRPAVSLILPPSSEDDDPLSPYGIAAIAAQSSPRIFAALEREGYGWDKVASEVFRFCREVERDYKWNDPVRLDEWVSSAHSAFWFDVRALIGREASMRLLGSYARSALIPAGVDRAYDVFHPIYDAQIDLLRPQQLPVEFGAADWLSEDSERNAWAEGTQADSWTSYPMFANGLHLLGEKTFLRKPMWDWQREERYRGLSLKLMDVGGRRENFMTARQLTHALYLEGHAQAPAQLIICNNEQQLLGATYGWVAFNAKIAHSMQWIPSLSEPFRWDNADGEMMVRSIFWKNGWIGLKPPHLVSLGEGWIVVASDAGLSAIKSAYPQCARQLWLTREQSGSNSFSRKWHLQENLS